MEFRIADTFTDSLAKLTGEEQKAVKTTAFDLQMDPSHPSLKFHRLDKAKDPNFWSVRVNKDVRLVVHKSDANLLLCYVAHHDDAYRWGERRKIERHPKTGAAQMVEIRETVKEIAVPKYVGVEKPAPPKPRLFADIPRENLLGYGVPGEWIDDVLEANEDTLFELAEHLPGEAAEALLDLATGVTPRVVAELADDTDPFEHPDALRRFRVMTNVEELERALEAPWERWTVFLHPAQRYLVEGDYGGPARVAGSAGTGKTIVALHRALYLARNHADVRVLLTTFSATLANALRRRLSLLIGNEPKLAERLEVHSIGTVARRLYETNLGPARVAAGYQVRTMLREQSAEGPLQKFSSHFLWTEWSEVVDAWQLRTWEDYRDVKRLGRKTRLAETQREILWSVFERTRAVLTERDMLTEADMFDCVSAKLLDAKHPAFEFAVVDEAQDMGVAQLRFLAALGGDRPSALFFAGDLGQRIFQQPYSWKALGVDVRGRSRTLRINYRTSHQIRLHVDRLLGPELSDVDGITEDRRGTVSVFNGPDPSVVLLDTPGDEGKAVAAWIGDRLGEDFNPHEIAVFVRSPAEMGRAREAVEALGVPAVPLDEGMETRRGSLSLATMHLAKGLEFRAVAVMACDDDVIPLQERIEGVTDESDLEDVYQTERHLLYVACTRARDRLMVSGVRPGSEFLEDLRERTDGL